MNENNNKSGVKGMNLETLKSSPQMMNMLVRLHDSYKNYQVENLSGMAENVLVESVMEVMNTSVQDEHEGLVTEIIISLIRQAEIDLRQAVSEKLSVMDNAPLRVILHLANDDIAVATPVLEHSKVLSPQDLMYIIKSQGAEYWQAIAKREGLDAPVVDALAKTEDVQTAINLTENKKTDLTPSAVEVFIALSAKSETLAKPLVYRKEVPLEAAARIYQYVGEKLKAEILDHYDVDEMKISKVIDSVAHELTTPEDFSPTADIIEASETLSQQGRLDVKTLLDVLRRGQTKSFVAMLAKYTGISAERTLSVVSQPTGQGLAIICKANEISKADFITMYLHSQQFRSKDRIVNQADFQKATVYYDKVTKDMAMDLLKKDTTVH